MDDRRFDRLTRALATAANRRHALLGALAVGATAFVGYRRGEAQEPPADLAAPAAPGTTLCAGEGQPCVMLTGCCSGFTCVTSAINPNQGFCQSGGSGGVEIAPPLMGGATDASTQPAPTHTPRNRKTHTPGDNKGTNSTTKAAYDLRVSLDCGSATNPIETTTIRNIGSESVKLAKFVTPNNPDYPLPDGWPPHLSHSLHPGKSVKFFSNTGDTPLSALPKGVWWSQDEVYLDGKEADDIVVYVDETTATFPASCGGTRTGSGSGHKRKHKKNKHKSK